MPVVGTGKLEVRRATTGDIATLVRLRLALFYELGMLKPGDDEAPAAASARRYLIQYLPTDAYAAWIAEYEREPVATASLIVMQKMPTPQNLSGLEGYVMGVYTAPDRRRLGAAAAVMQALLDEARVRALPRVSLSASAAGRPLYERLGFVLLDAQMRWQPE